MSVPPIVTQENDQQQPSQELKALTRQLTEAFEQMIVLPLTNQLAELQQCNNPQALLAFELQFSQTAQHAIGHLFGFALQQLVDLPAIRQLAFDRAR